MESFTSILDKIEFADNDDVINSKPIFSKSKGFSLRSGSNTPRGSGPTTPRCFSPIPGSRSGSNTPRGAPETPRSDISPISLSSVDDVTPTKSGYSTPRSLGESYEGSSPWQLKIELVEKALCDEVVIRAEAEQKVAQLEEMVCRLKSELDRAKSQSDTVAVINKQMGVELRFLRQRNTRAVAERQQWEDALISETQKRRELQKQVQMLVSSFKEKNAEETARQPCDGGGGGGGQSHVSLQEQEAIFSRQREEVLLGVVESLRSQLDKAEVQAEEAKLEWSEERARYQETHDLLRFQIDQLTLTRGGSGGLTSSQPKDDIDEKIDDVIHKYDERKSSRRSNIRVSSEMLDKPNNNQMEADVESKLKEPTTPTSPITTSSPPSSLKKTTYQERMKVFFLSSFWWPKLDFLKIGESASFQQPLRPPVLLLQIAWWVAELREYIMTNHVNLRLLAHSNQFCNCDDCVQHIASYAINNA